MERRPKSNHLKARTEKPSKEAHMGDRLLRAEVEVWSSKKQAADWLPCTITGRMPGDISEDFSRINVRLDDGREFYGCHPNCVILLP